MILIAKRKQFRRGPQSFQYKIFGQKLLATLINNKDKRLLLIIILVGSVQRPWNGGLRALIQGAQACEYFAEAWSLVIF